MKNSLYQRTVKLLENEHRNINIESASLLNDKIKDDADNKFSENNFMFYQQSGLKFIFDKLVSKKSIKQSLKFLFIENSNMPSALLNNQLDAFSLTWEDNNNSRFNNNVSLWFQHIIVALQITKNVLFWHKQFFHEPQEGQAIITICDSFDKNPLEGRKVLSRLFNKTFSELKKNIESKGITQQTTPYSICYDESNLTTVHVAMGQIPFDFNEFKTSNIGKVKSKDELNPPPSVLHTLNHIFYDFFFKGKICLRETIQINDTEKDLFYKDKLLLNKSDFYDLSKVSDHRQIIDSKFLEDLSSKGCKCDSECETNTIFVSIPVLCANPKKDGKSSTKDNLKGFGALFLYLGVDVNSDKLQLLDELEEFCKEITTHLRSFAQGYVFSLNNKIEETATRAAVSQVMARNLSHNIGSHIMNKLIDGKSLSKIDINYFNFAEKRNKTYIPAFELYKNIEENTVDLIFDQLAIFNTYLKCRMDYISDITFGKPLMQTNKLVRSEIQKDFDKVRLLLENISGLSDFVYEVRFLSEGVLINDETDLTIALPNDLLGCQAFYNILENIIRNTAKHQDIENADKTVFTVNFKTINKNDLKEVADSLKDEANLLYCVEISDDIDITGTKTDFEVGFKDQYIKDINAYSGSKEINSIEDISEIDWLVYSQNKRLNNSLLKENRQLRASALGLIEMEASASYLRKIDVFSVEDEEYRVDFDDKIYNHANKFNILKAFKKINSEKGNNYNLGYRIFMLRPTELLIITDKIDDSSKINKLKKEGIWVLTPKKFRTELEDNCVYNHQFLIYHNLEVIISEDETINLFLDNYRTSLPIRILEYSEEELTDLLSCESITNNIWKKWEDKLKSIYNYSCIKVSNSPLNKEDKEKIAILSDHDATLSCLANSNLKPDYFEALSSKARQKLPDFVKLSLGAPQSNEITNYNNNIYQEQDQHILQMLSESILSKVLVIDERIQEAYIKKYENTEITVSELVKASGIICPDKSRINLSSKLIDDIINYIKNELQDLSFSNLDFLLIHYSILERIFKSDKGKINAFLNADSTKIDEKYLIPQLSRINVIVTSGRGTPEGLTQKVRFINLSSVINAFVDIRSKFLVNSLLYSTRKTNKL